MSHIMNTGNKKMYNIFYWPGTRPAFDDVGKVIKYHISSLGYDIVISDNIVPGKINILFGVNVCIQGNNSVLNQIPDDSIIVNLEQLAIGAWNHVKYINILKRFQVWDYSTANIEWMKKQGINNIGKINIGYSDVLTSGIHNKEKDIDVLFYGAINDRRKAILDQISSHNIKIYYSNYNLFDNERDIMISRSKIVINVHYYIKNIFEVVRVSHLLSNKAFVISEMPDSKEEYDYWKDAVVFTEYDNIVNTIIKYLDNEEDRNRLTEQGYNIIKSRPFSLPAVSPPSPDISINEQGIIYLE